MSPLARTWLRRIALGLPLVAITPLAGCTGSNGVAGCGGTRRSTQRFALDDATRARLEADAGTSPCVEVCNELEAMRVGGAASTFPGPTCTIVSDPAGDLLQCDFQMYCRGRPPAGLVAARTEASSAIGDFLASAAHLEAASVPAFVDLARELALHGGPRAMRDAAMRAAGDEVRHASAMRALASLAGAEAPPVSRRATEPRSFVAMAEDNAVHGCAGEAHAALVAAFQAEHATDRALRAVWSEIARDEARHALLSMAIHDDALTRLAPRDARHVEALRRDAVDALARASEREEPADVRASMSLPDADRAVALARALA